MNLNHVAHRLLKSLLVTATVAACALPTLARADSPSIAYGSQNKWAWAVRGTSAEADATALALCNKDAAKKDCHLEVYKFVAKAVGAKRSGFGRSVTSEAEARATAIKSCAEASCKVVDVWSKPGFYSLAKPKTGDGSFYFIFGGNNSDQVDKEATSACEANNGTPCGVVWSSAIGGKLDTPVAQARPEPAPSTGDCRPRTQALRCSSRCYNGSCTVTYENGCKIHVDVNAVFDSFNNQWNYPAPSC